jgi:hypothetical protein
VAVRVLGKRDSRSNGKQQKEGAPKPHSGSILTTPVA